MKEIHILLVEDNEGDIVLMLETFKNLTVKNTNTVVRDGEEAIQFLNKQGFFKNAPTPDIVLMDINLPKIDGIEVLQFIKGNDLLKSIPVIILTTSSSQSDINKSYQAHANCYIVKPLDFNKFAEVIKSIENFWLSTVQLPVK